MSMSRFALAAVSLLLAAPFATAADQVVRIDPAGWPSALAETPREIAPGEALWIWSDSCAPRRVSSFAAADCQETGPVDVRVTARDRKLLAGATIRWGTEAMLRELPDNMLPSASTYSSGGVTIQIA